VLLSDGRATTAIDVDGRIEPGHRSLPQYIDGLLRARSRWQRGDFHRPTGPPREVEVAGRLGWEVALEAPKQKFGPLVLVVDDETGMLLGYRNEHPDQGWLAEFRELELNAPAAGTFVHRSIRAPDGPARVAERRQALNRLAATLPRVRHWPPGFRSSVRPFEPEPVVATVRFHDPQAEVRLLRVPDDAQLPETSELPVRWQRDGWRYSMGIDGREFDEDEVRRIQDGVIERPND
jgi:hypothetical protein